MIVLVSSEMLLSWRTLITMKITLMMLKKRLW
nr:unnamed protein product [Callosobruchus analis]